MSLSAAESSENVMDKLGVDRDIINVVDDMQQSASTSMQRQHTEDALYATYSVTNTYETGYDNQMVVQNISPGSSSTEAAFNRISSACIPNSPSTMLTTTPANVIKSGAHVTQSHLVRPTSFVQLPGASRGLIVYGPHSVINENQVNHPIAGFLQRPLAQAGRQQTPPRITERLDTPTVAAVQQTTATRVPAMRNVVGIDHAGRQVTRPRPVIPHNKVMINQGLVALMPQDVTMSNSGVEITGISQAPIMKKKREPAKRSSNNTMAQLLSLQGVTNAIRPVSSPLVLPSSTNGLPRQRTASNNNQMFTILTPPGIKYPVVSAGGGTPIISASSLLNTPHASMPIRIPVISPEIAAQNFIPMLSLSGQYSIPNNVSLGTISVINPTSTTSLQTSQPVFRSPSSGQNKSPLMSVRFVISSRPGTSVAIGGSSLMNAGAIPLLVPGMSSAVRGAVSQGIIAVSPVLSTGSVPVIASGIANAVRTGVSIASLTHLQNSMSLSNFIRVPLPGNISLTHPALTNLPSLRNTLPQGSISQRLLSVPPPKVQHTSAGRASVVSLLQSVTIPKVVRKKLIKKLNLPRRKRKLINGAKYSLHLPYSSGDNDLEGIWDEKLGVLRIKRPRLGPPAVLSKETNVKMAKTSRSRKEPLQKLQQNVTALSKSVYGQTITSTYNSTVSHATLLKGLATEATVANLGSSSLALTTQQRRACIACNMFCEEANCSKCGDKTAIICLMGGGQAGTNSFSVVESRLTSPVASTSNTLGSPLMTNATARAATTMVIGVRRAMVPGSLASVRLAPNKPWISNSVPPLVNSSSPSLLENKSGTARIEPEVVQIILSDDEEMREAIDQGKTLVQSNITTLQPVAGTSTEVNRTQSVEVMPSMDVKVTLIDVESKPMDIKVKPQDVRTISMSSQSSCSETSASVSSSQHSSIEQNSVSTEQSASTSSSVTAVNVTQFASSGLVSKAAPLDMSTIGTSKIMISSGSSDILTSSSSSSSFEQLGATVATVLPVLFTQQLRQLFVGTYPVMYSADCTYTARQIRVTFTSETVAIDPIVIDTDNIRLMLLHFGPCGPVVFLQLCAELGAALRAQFKLTSSSAGHYYDPDSADPPQRLLIFIPKAPTVPMPEANIRLHITTMTAARQFAVQTITSEAASVYLHAAMKVRAPAPVATSVRTSQTVVYRCVYTTATGQVVTRQTIEMPVIAAVEGDEADDPAMERSRSPSPPPRASFSGPIIRLFTYPPPPAKGGISVSNEDYFCLQKDEFLNDVIIDFYLQYVLLEMLSAEDRARTHVCSSFFYRRLTQREPTQSSSADAPAMSIDQLRHSRVSTWTKRVDLFAKDFIIVPINESAHWYLAVICYPGLMEPVLADVPSESTLSTAGTGPTSSNTDNGGEGDKSGGSQAEQQPVSDATGTGEPTSTTKTSTEAATLSAAASTAGVATSAALTAAATSSTATVKAATASEDGDRIILKRPSNLIENICRVFFRPCILVFDSLAIAQRYNVVRTLREYLQSEWNAKKLAKEGPRSFSKENMRGACPTCPQQTNTSDCGVYVLQYIESFFKTPIKDYRMPITSLSDWFTKEDIAAKRGSLKQLVVDLQHRLNPTLKYDPEEVCLTVLPRSLPPPPPPPPPPATIDDKPGSSAVAADKPVMIKSEIPETLKSDATDMKTIDIQSVDVRACAASSEPMCVDDTDSGSHFRISSVTSLKDGENITSQVSTISLDDSGNTDADVSNSAEINSQLMMTSGTLPDVYGREGNSLANENHSVFELPMNYQQTQNDATVSSQVADYPIFQSQNSDVYMINDRNFSSTYNTPEQPSYVADESVGVEHVRCNLATSSHSLVGPYPSAQTIVSDNLRSATSCNDDIHSMHHAGNPVTIDDSDEQMDVSSSFNITKDTRPYHRTEQDNFAEQPSSSFNGNPPAMFEDSMFYNSFRTDVVPDSVNDEEDIGDELPSHFVEPFTDRENRYDCEDYGDHHQDEIRVGVNEAGHSSVVAVNNNVDSTSGVGVDACRVIFDNKTIAAEVTEAGHVNDGTNVSDNDLSQTNTESGENEEVILLT